MDRSHFTQVVRRKPLSRDASTAMLRAHDTVAFENSALEVDSKIFQQASFQEIFVPRLLHSFRPPGWE
jgi:hypothetical protein